MDRPKTDSFISLRFGLFFMTAGVLIVAAGSSAAALFCAEASCVYSHAH
mgnify:CR=1 FL=1